MRGKINEDKETRRKKRQFKKRRSRILAITILLIVGTVGIVNAQAIGYEVIYKGESIGSVQSPKIFNAAIRQVENELQGHYANEGVTINHSFEFVQGRIADPMNLDECVAVLKKANIDIYVNGAEIFIGNKIVGAVSSVTEAQNIIGTREKLLPEIKDIRFEEKVVPLAETKDFSAMIDSMRNEISK